MVQKRGKEGGLMIELKHIDIGFAQKQCITDGSFCARDGQITVICGESGTGKSALLNLIAMLDQKNTCEYMHQGKLLQLSASEKERFRNRHMSYMHYCLPIIRSWTI